MSALDDLLEQASQAQVTHVTTGQVRDAMARDGKVGDRAALEALHDDLLAGEFDGSDAGGFAQVAGMLRRALDGSEKFTETQQRAVSDVTYRLPGIPFPGKVETLEQLLSILTTQAEHARGWHADKEEAEKALADMRRDVEGVRRLFGTTFNLKT